MARHVHSRRAGRRSDARVLPINDEASQNGRRRRGDVSRRASGFSASGDRRQPLIAPSREFDNDRGPDGRRSEASPVASRRGPQREPARSSPRLRPFRRVELDVEPRLYATLLGHRAPRAGARHRRLYGLIAYSVSQRRHEFGVRVALGAAQSTIMRLAVGEGLRPGRRAGNRARRRRRGNSFARRPGRRRRTEGSGHVCGRDVVLVAAVMLASYSPARRAARGIRSWPCVTNNKRFIRAERLARRSFVSTGNAHTARRRRACAAGDFIEAGRPPSPSPSKGRSASNRAGRPSGRPRTKSTKRSGWSDADATIEGVALVNGVEFKNRTNEVDLAAFPAAAATGRARNRRHRVSVGGTRETSSVSAFDRPTDGPTMSCLGIIRPVRLPPPPFPWRKLRAENPGVYEPYVDSKRESRRTSASTSTACGPAVRQRRATTGADREQPETRCCQRSGRTVDRLRVTEAYFRNLRITAR